MFERGIYGIDVHKPSKPKIPECGGVAVLLSITISSILALLMLEEYRLKIMVFITSVVYVGILGFIDDLKPLNAKLKTLLTMISIIPVIVFRVYNPRPFLPFIGRTRLTIIYTLALPFAIGVTSNAANMMDTYNGSLISTSILIYIALLASSIIGYSRGLLDGFGIIASAIMLGALIGYYRYNRYPSRVFNGDVGSLSIGASIGLTAILANLEVIAITAMMPYIMNGFYIISTIKGLKERREIKVRPVIVKNGLLYANTDPKSPLTLAHLILVRGPLKEKELVDGIVVLQLTATILAIVMAIFTFTL